VTKLIVGFTLGVLTALSFRHIPPIFTDSPETPSDWQPKFRHWVNGIPVDESIDCGYGPGA
jgi:hypothetical protein